MQRVAILIFLVALSTATWGQTSEELQEITPQLAPTQGMFFRVSTPLYPALSYEFGGGNLRNALRAQGFRSPFLSINSSVDFGVGYYNNNWMVDAEVGLPDPNPLSRTHEVPRNNISYRISRALYRAAVSGGYGINVSDDKKLFFKAGAGYLQNEYHIIGPGTTSAFNFNNITAPSGSVFFQNISQQQSYIDFSVELWQNPIRKVDVRRNTVLGYRTGFNRKPWEVLNTAQVINPIEDSFSMIYIKVTYVVSVSR